MDAPEPRSPEPRRRFDRTTWNKLQGIDLRLLDTLMYLSRLTAARSPRRAHYCTPGRRWLAKTLACSVETITRHTRRLAELGIIAKRQRRPENGQYQTAIYWPRHEMCWAIGRVMEKVRRTCNRLSFQAAKTPLQSRGGQSPSSSEALRAVIARGMAKFAPG